MNTAEYQLSIAINETDTRRIYPTWAASEMLNELEWHRDPSYEWNEESVGAEQPGDRDELTRIYNKLCAQSATWGIDHDDDFPATMTLSDAEWDFIYRFTIWEDKDQHGSEIRRLNDDDSVMLGNSLMAEIEQARPAARLGLKIVERALEETQRIVDNRAEWTIPNEYWEVIDDMKLGVTWERGMSDEGEV